MPPTFGAPVRVASCKTIVILTSRSIPLDAVAHLARQIADEALDGMGDLTVVVKLETFIAAILEFHVFEAVIESADDVWTDQKHCSRNVFDLAVFLGDPEIVEQTLVASQIVAEIGRPPILRGDQPDAWIAAEQCNRIGGDLLVAGEGIQERPSPMRSALRRDMPGSFSNADEGEGGVALDVDIVEQPDKTADIAAIVIG